MRYWYMLQHGWTLKTYWVIEDSHIRLHIIWFYVCKMSRISKPIRTKSSLVVSQGWNAGVQEVRKKWRLSANGYEVSLGSDGKKMF